MKQIIINIKSFCLYSLMAFCVMISNSKAYYEIDVEPSSIDDGMVAIYGQACETIKPNEPRSSARIRVTDKATFVGVSDIADLSDLREKLNGHDFNVTVYNIVDNLIEDMAVRTIQQDNNNICVEVTGFISRDNIYKSAENSLSSVVLEEDNDELGEPINLTNIIEENEGLDKPLVYIAPTEFYNNTKSAKHAEILKSLLSQKQNFAQTDEEDSAKYIIKSKVLRAKVDPINSSTNRLQMVVSVELQSSATKISITEHQNKFVLFGEEEDEQKVAFDLMKKLMEKAAEPIIAKIEMIEEKSNMGSLITPTHNKVIRHD